MTRRLVDLDPEWWSDARGRFGQGLSFVCPHCRSLRLSVAFANPIDGNPPAEFPTWMLYTRAGSTFDTLTVRPPVVASSLGHGIGDITDGSVVWR